MGQQIAIAATATDEDSFLAFLRKSAEIQLFVPSAATIDMQTAVGWLDPETNVCCAYGSACENYLRGDANRLD